MSFYSKQMSKIFLNFIYLLVYKRKISICIQYQLLLARSEASSSSRSPPRPSWIWQSWRDLSLQESLFAGREVNSTFSTRWASSSSPSFSKSDGRRVELGSLLGTKNNSASGSSLIIFRIKIAAQRFLNSVLVILNKWSSNPPTHDPVNEPMLSMDMSNA